MRKENAAAVTAKATAATTIMRKGNAAAVTVRATAVITTIMRKGDAAGATEKATADTTTIRKLLSRAAFCPWKAMRKLSSR